MKKGHRRGLEYSTQTLRREGHSSLSLSWVEDVLEGWITHKKGRYASFCIYREAKSVIPYAVLRSPLHIPNYFVLPLSLSVHQTSDSLIQFPSKELW